LQRRDYRRFILMDNMVIWNKVEKTDPKYTKDAKVKGGYKITAINATYQAMQMTKQFGVYGIGWGLENVKYEIIKLSDDFHDNILVFKADLFYVLEDKKGIAPIDSEIDIWVYSKSYKSWSKNNDSYKKVKTDAMTKGFSLLGVSADVFMGLYDDNKYVNEVRHEFEEKIPPVDQKTLYNDTSDKIVRQYIGSGKMLDTQRADLIKELDTRKLIACPNLVDALIKEYGALNA
jgi:hypothetical protein